MKPETHRLDELDGVEECEFCNRDASYYTQAVADDEAALSRIIIHCQKHRHEARVLAEKLGS